MKDQAVYFDLCDFGLRSDKEDNYFVKILSEKFDMQLTTSPDYLFYSFGSDVHRLYTCKKIYWTPESDLPDFRQCDFAITSRYLDDPRHLRVPFYVFYVQPEDLIKKPEEWTEIPKTKTKFCSFLTTYANKKTNKRVQFFHKLNARKKVDSAGRALNNVGYTVPFSHAAKQEFLAPYKFYMAFENSSVPGYITEKLVEGMRSRCIPIYFGCPRVAEEFNPRSFLNYHAFPSEEALIDRILEIDHDDSLYEQYLREPFFYDNKPTKVYDKSRIWDFFEKIVNSDDPPVSAKRRLLGRWMLVKRNKF